MATFKVSGRDWEIKTFALSTTDTAITFTTVAKAFIFQNRGDADLEVRRLTTDSAYWTLKAGSTISLDVDMGGNVGTTLTVGQVRTKSGTDTLEVINIF